MKFIHAADLHIDSPLKGLDAQAGAPVQRLRSATREAVTQLVDFALQRQADFVIVAGDVFDGPWPDMRTGIWTAQQFGQLSRAGIPVFMLRGNHDAQSRVRQSVAWPELVREFSTEQPETFVLEELGVALHGQGFATPQVTQDLAAGYPPARAGMFNIGVLHTSLTGDPQHDTYAPASEETLLSKNYDYWALGHIHQRRVIRERAPHIAFSGNTQGRHIREVGPKGCSLVTVEQGALTSVEFLPTDSLRWMQVTIDLGPQDTLEDLYGRLRQRMERCHEEAEGRFAAVRVTVRGACEAHRQIAAPARREEAIADIRIQAAQVEDVWVERVLLDTSAPIDLDQLRQGNDLLAQLLRDIRDTGADEQRLLKLAECLQPLSAKAPRTLADANVLWDDPEQLRRWLHQAEGLLATLLDSDS